LRPAGLSPDRRPPASPSAPLPSTQQGWHRCCRTSGRARDGSRRRRGEQRTRPENAKISQPPPASTDGMPSTSPKSARTFSACGENTIACIPVISPTVPAGELPRLPPAAAAHATADRRVYTRPGAHKACPVMREQQPTSRPDLLRAHLGWCGDGAAQVRRLGQCWRSWRFYNFLTEYSTAVYSLRLPATLGNCRPPRGWSHGQPTGGISEKRGGEPLPRAGGDLGRSGRVVVAGDRRLDREETQASAVGPGGGHPRPGRLRRRRRKPTTPSGASPTGPGMSSTALRLPSGPGNGPGATSV
jgi:hypothetical protein